MLSRFYYNAIQLWGQSAIVKSGEANRFHLTESLMQIWERGDESKFEVSLKMARNCLAENAPPLVKADLGSGNNLLFSTFHWNFQTIGIWDSSSFIVLCSHSVFLLLTYKECLCSHFNSIWDGIGYDFGRICKTSLKAKIRFQEFARSCWISFCILDFLGQN